VKENQPPGNQQVNIWSL